MNISKELSSSLDYAFNATTINPLGYDRDIPCHHDIERFMDILEIRGFTIVPLMGTKPYPAIVADDE